MRNHGLVLAVLAACASSKPHSTSGNFEDCYYDCKPGQKTASGSAATATPPATPPPGGKLTPAGEKAASLREAADLLDKAQTALGNGNKNLADQLFSTAELLVGQDMLASLEATFHAGAPPLVAGPTEKIDPNTPPQPKVVGSSEQEDAEAKVPPPRVEGSLTGVVQIDGKPLSGAYGLVTLEPASGKWAPRTPKRRSVEQRNREFLPHVLAVPVGSTVAFPNYDNVFHNVFSTSPLAPFDLGIYKVGEAREYTFNKEGIIRLGCNLHAGMSAYIVVVNAPAYVVTDDSGHFAFKHLAPGKYKLHAWSERSQTPITQDVTVKQGSNAISVGVAADAPAGAQPDKFGGKRG
ncbi:MAG TPA: carboxypeptidase regulatory-like domain-containing protein [Kofleriaceae bacterium]|jgi:plastocyanin